MDKFRDLAQINPSKHLSANDLKKQIELIQKQQEQNNADIQTMLSNNSSATQIREAFKVDSSDKRLYKDYDEYQNATNSNLTREEYDSAAYLYDLRDQLQEKLKESKEKYKQEIDNEQFKKSGKK